MPKDKGKKGIIRGAGPLDVQLKEDVTVETQTQAKAERRRKFIGGKGPGASMVDDEDEDAFDDMEAEAGDSTYIPAKISRKILTQARAQQFDEDADDSAAHASSSKKVRFGTSRKSTPASAILRGKGSKHADEEEEEEEIIEFADEDGVQLDGDYIAANMDGYDLDAEGLAAEEAILRKFMPDAPTERRTLADIIMEKIKEKEEATAATAATAGDTEDGLDPKIVEVYTEVGRYLSHYRSGKLPKVFKVIPGLSNWEEILFLTNPETWTPHATYAATRIFASNFNPAKAQRFFSLILLPKCRDDIYFNKRLNFHLYISLKKATYKPAAFYKGIILPLAAEPDVTLREAIIFGSVITKVSIPQIHSAATLMKLSEMRYNGGISVLVKTLVNKKYTLPYLVVDAVAKHFAEFLNIPGPLPVIWHQSLLAFVQRYKADLTSDQKDVVRQLLHLHVHHSITPEIRREVFSAGCRGDAPTMPLPAVPVLSPSTPAVVAPVKVAKKKQAAAMDVEY